MRFLLDMGLAQSTGSYLRSLGHEAVHLRDEGLHRLPDEQIVLKAIKESRAILTADLDFGRIVALSRGAWPSVITFRLGDMRPITVNSVLAAVLETLEPDLVTGVLVSIDDRAVRVRRLPVGQK